jgi:hypothetical protein
MYFDNETVFGTERQANRRVTNSELRTAFSDGEVGVRNQTGSMATIELRNGDTALVGYGHAIYAERDADSGEITVHAGWTDWAISQHNNAEATPRHISRLMDRFENARITDRQPSAASKPDSVREIGRFGLRSEVSR